MKQVQSSFTLINLRNSEVNLTQYEKFLNSLTLLVKLFLARFFLTISRPTLFAHKLKHLCDCVQSLLGMYFKVYGVACCHWTESQSRTTGSGENRRTTNHTVHFRGENVYLNTKTYLFGYDGAPAVEIPSGTHRYNFALQLPPLLPASFEATHGHIRYDIEAVLDVPWGFDREFKLQFTVLRNNDDLNHDPLLRIPCQMEDITTFCCFCCQSAPLIMTVNVPRTGFAPGQNIPININFVNKSDVDVTRTKINLKRIIRYNR